MDATLTPSSPEHRTENSNEGARANDAIKARAKLNLLLASDGQGKGEILAATIENITQPEITPEIEILIGQSGSTGVSATLSASTVYALDLTKFVAAPAISNAVVSFGSLGVGSSFFDNNIKVCGASQNGTCANASIRAYTTQNPSVSNPGDGLWNATDGYGVPIRMTATSGSKKTIRLGQSNFEVLQTISFPGSQRVLTFSDWTLGGISPSYAIEADFTNAGAGVYTATLVLEYALGQ
ncbi:MAG: hypothetical protein RJB38_338 [Pseudomonadota bacterium]|jgi:hypothetical protein